MLRVEGLSKTYADGTRALKGVSFTVKPGEFVVILGKSGSGKSTLLRCINRLVEPTAGQVTLDGREITGAGPALLRELRQKMGMIFQQYSLVGRLSVGTNAMTGGLGALPSWMGLAGYFPREMAETAQDHLERAGIGDKTASRADTLSGGQQQRVGIARALMQEPQLILADEPVSSLDPASSRTIMDILKEINEKSGVTLLCNLHLPGLAREYGHRVLALKAGELVFDGAPKSLDEKTLEAFYESD
ncbi:phosphonate ABC transporter ATP-binidng protein [Candidatus Nitromaritima sp. SCGC AAA799-A02]|nr:phosphonate ABC transporter ATP-binidng protein [Candidatus Nitromaritima sp. SCGC AAA799-A02]KMP11502.1 phosphonate ABC transporter ATP-binidng protein [Candidatus Nitromaritima sp. SCGC AAA799-C22]